MTAPERVEATAVVRDVLWLDDGGLNTVPKMRHNKLARLIITALTKHFRSDAAVERVAREFWAFHPELCMQDRTAAPWSELLPIEREELYRQAKTAIDALLGVEG